MLRPHLTTPFLLLSLTHLRQCGRGVGLEHGSVIALERCPLGMKFTGKVGHASSYDYSVTVKRFPLVSRDPVARLHHARRERQGNRHDKKEDMAEMFHKNPGSPVSGLGDLVPEETIVLRKVGR